MTFTQSIEKREFQTLFVKSLLLKPLFVFFGGLYFLVLTSAGIFAFLENEDVQFFSLIEPLLPIFVLPLILRFAAGRQYNDNIGNFQNVSYEINENSIKTTSSMGTSEFYLNGIRKVKNFEKWLLVYPNKSAFIPIKKGALSEDQMAEFKKVFKDFL